MGREAERSQARGCASAPLEPRTASGSPHLMRAYIVCVILVGAMGFVGATPAGQSVVPAHLGWVPAATWVGSAALGLALIAALMAKARRGGGSAALRGLLFLPLIAGMSTCALAPLPVEHVRADGLDRSYRVYAPSSYDGTRSYPLVLVLHGFLQDWKSIRNLSRFDRIAEREAALIVYPSGYRRSWNDGDDSKPATAAGLDDAEFLRRVIGRVSQTHNVDAGRIYAVGFSNSGFLLVRHACELADRIAAIGVVAAGVYPVWDPACRGSRRVPAMFIIGSADPMLASLQRFEVEPSRSAPLWSAVNGCREHTAEPVPDRADDGTRSRRVEYEACTDGAEVVAIRVEGGGHTWPGGPQYLPAFLIGPTSRDFDATEEIWEFFSAVGDTR